jgi:hypothetical protein
MLAAVLVLAALGCGGETDDGERFAVYHLELVLGPPGAEGELRCGPERPVCPGVITQPPPREVRYHVSGAPGFEGDEIERAAVRAHGAVLSIPLTGEGTTALASLSREVARHGGRDFGWHHLLVVIGDEVVAFPEVDYDRYPDGYPNASVLELEAGSPGDARELARRLRGS